MTLRAMVVGVRAVDGPMGALPRGHHAHAFFLRFIQAVDPALSQYLHDEQGRKPYTVGLAGCAAVHALDTRNGGKRPDLSLRLTILNEDVFARFLERLTTLAQSTTDDQGLRLGNTPIAVSSLIEHGAPGGIVGKTEFNELLRSAGNSPNVILQFSSPTAFSLGSAAGRRHIGVLPDTGLVFHSLLRKWNEFAPPGLQLDPAWRSVIEEEVAIAAHEMRTEAFTFPRHAQVGFVGWCRYHVLSNDLDLLRLVNTLANFAAYAGVGSKTTMGMGQTWRHAATPERVTRMSGQCDRDLPRLSSDVNEDPESIGS